METAKDDPAVQVDQNSWDVFEDFRAGGAGHWLYDQRLQQLTEITFDLTLYIAAAEICGPRALADDRDAWSRVAAIDGGRTQRGEQRSAGGDNGPLLLQGPQGGAVGHGFITPRLAEYLHETQYDD